MASNDSSSEVLTRMAFGTSGRIGSLYDACEDIVLDGLEAKTRDIPPKEKISKCEIIKGNSDQAQKPLEMINIEADLRLSILLHSSLPKTAITRLINHSKPFNEYTRFLCYTYVQRTEELDTPTEFSNYADLLKTNRKATHIITNISWGINVVVVLELLPHDERITVIDEKLEEIRDFLKGDQNNVKFSLEDEELFENHVKITIYSNIPSVNKITSILTLCQYINGRDERFNFYRPLKYQMKPIKELYPDYSESEINYCSLPSPLIENIEKHVTDLKVTMKKLKDLSTNSVNGTIHKHLQERITKVQKEWEKVKNIHNNHINQLQTLIIKTREGQGDTSQINQTLDLTSSSVWKDLIQSFTENLNKLNEKEQLIINLCSQHFVYYNVAKLTINSENYKEILPVHLTKEQTDCRILCSSDILNQQDPLKFDKLRDQLIKQYQQNENLRLFYADFSYCSFQLPDTIIIASGENTNNKTTPKLYPSLSKTDEVINILLLGESGVGKSTFINAFVNYLAFKTLDQAESNEPIVLIPVSFLMTTGDSFEERIINFGNYNDFNNENFDHPGQSVTQHCKSYLFTFNHIVGKKIRIIDTPGFGDTRDLDQDDLNMEYILKYINNISHINAVCFLLKPNLAQLNHYFSACVTKLFSLLSHQARQNVIFCFTNARSTFYTPGDTAPLLKSMLNTFSSNDIPFQKENTFCFDNEAFRYLVTRKNGIQFNQLDRSEYERSWLISVNESKRLINYIDRQLTSYSLLSASETIKHAQIEIMQMVRPMLEAMRNILRQIVLYDMKIHHVSVKLIPRAIRRPASLCNGCELDIVRIAFFQIISDVPHEMLNTCYQCKCESSKHSSIDYFLHYQSLDGQSEYSRNYLDNQLQQLRRASNEFAYFLIRLCAIKDDPFLTGLQNMINDEKFLLKNRESNELNEHLVQNLKILENNYENKMNRMHANKNDIDLSFIYETIEQISASPEVQEQMAAIKTTQQMLMEEYEYVIPENLTDRSTYHIANTEQHY